MFFKFSTVNFLILLYFLHANSLTQEYVKEEEPKKDTEFSEHNLVTDNEVFPYVAAILEDTAYLCAGALIDDNWVLTSASKLRRQMDKYHKLKFIINELTPPEPEWPKPQFVKILVKHDNAPFKPPKLKARVAQSTYQYPRIIRVRLGSINYKKGGVVMPVKLFEIHPQFDIKKPQHDLMMIQLPWSVSIKHNLSPIRLQRRLTEVTATHFIVTSWTAALRPPKEFMSIDLIKRKHFLSVSHLHPVEFTACSHLSENNESDCLICLEHSLGTRSCSRDAGAPVVLNGELWGILSGWKPDTCYKGSGGTFVNLVAHPNNTQWIHATIQGHRWGEREEPITPVRENRFNDAFTFENEFEYKTSDFTKPKQVPQRIEMNFDKLENKTKLNISRENKLPGSNELTKFNTISFDNETTEMEATSLDQEDKEKVINAVNIYKKIKRVLTPTEFYPNTSTNSVFKIHKHVKNPTRNKRKHIGYGKVKGGPENNYYYSKYNKKISKHDNYNNLNKYVDNLAENKSIDNKNIGIIEDTEIDKLTKTTNTFIQIEDYTENPSEFDN